jgi:glucose/arabinose dehydrogenase
VALAGDRAPFATSGRPIIGPIGYKVVSVDLDSKRVDDFVRNTAGGPASRIDEKNPNLLERPIDVKIGPDGTVFILDAGRMQVRDGRETYETGTGKIFRVVPTPGPVMQE